MHPLFVSVKFLEPDFSFESMDVITDKSVVRNLLRWVQRQNEVGERRGKIRDFCVEAELLGDKTLVLYQPGADKTYVAGVYRKNLELDHSSLPLGWEQTFGHNRIISYEFGDLDMLIRFPVDIANPQLENDPTKSLTLTGSQSVRDLGELQHSSQGLSYIRHEGKPIFQSAMAEIMVRSSNGAVEWNNVWHQLYFSWTENLFVVNHNGQLVTGMTRSFLTRTGGLVNAIQNSKTDLKNVEILLNKMRLYLVHLREERGEMSHNSNLKLQFRFFDGKREVEIHEIFTPSNVVVD